MNRPWSVIDDEELRLLRQLRDEVMELRRGCDCDYDYRCRNCSYILRAAVTAAAAKEAQR